jgi:hypothetical protein
MSFEQAWVIVKNEPRERQHHPIKRRTTAPPRKGERCLMYESGEACPNRTMTGANGLQSPLGLCASCYNRALDYEKKNRNPNDNAPRGEIEYAKEEKDFVEEVRDLVEQGMDVRSAVSNVARLLDLDGRNLMRAYTEAYR